MILLLKKQQTVLIIHKQLLKGESQSNLLLQRPPLYNGHIFCPRGQIIHTLTLSTTATLFNPQGGRCGEVQLYLHVTSPVIKSQRFTSCEFNEMQCINPSRTILTRPYNFHKQCSFSSNNCLCLTMLNLRLLPSNIAFQCKLISCYCL